MALCWRLGSVVQICCRPAGTLNRVHWTSVCQLSFLASQQGESKTFLAQPQLACLAHIPHNGYQVWKPRKFTAFHQKDGVGKEMVVVYDKAMKNQFFWSQLFINVMAVPIYAMCANIIISTWHLKDFSITSGVLTASLYLVSYSIFVVGVNMVCRRSISRIYMNKSDTTFAAVVQDWKMMSKTVYFDLSMVRLKPQRPVLAFILGNVFIKGRPYLVSPDDFRQPKYYNLLMGYDQQRPVELDVIKDMDIKTFVKQIKNLFDNKPSKKSG